MKTNHIALLEDECLDGVVGGLVHGDPFTLNEAGVVYKGKDPMPDGAQAALQAVFFPSST
jgi:hypothetical protein